MKVFPIETFSLWFSLLRWVTLHASSNSSIGREVLPCCFASKPISNKKSFCVVVTVTIRLMKAATEDTDRTRHHEDMHNGNFPIKSATFWRFSFCLSQVFGELKSEKFVEESDALERIKSFVWRILSINDHEELLWIIFKVICKKPNTSELPLVSHTKATTAVEQIQKGAGVRQGQLR